MCFGMLQEAANPEGLLEKQREPESRTPARCPFCHGSGKCFKCGGRGVRVVRIGRFLGSHTTVCRNCNGSGKCQLCRGKGTRLGEHAATIGKS